MTVQLATVDWRRSTRNSAGELLAEYLKRAGRYQTVELREYATERDLLETLKKTRSAPLLMLTDSRGKQLSSEELAGALSDAIDGGVQRIVVAVGPADGWTDDLLGRAHLVVAFGRITLPHELAALIAAEQIYRALTIRAGHPYHCGH